MSVDNGYRSKCCKAPVRLVKRKIKGVARGYSLVYQCVSCFTRNVDIIPKSELNSQPTEHDSFAE